MKRTKSRTRNQHSKAGALASGRDAAADIPGLNPGTRMTRTAGPAPQWPHKRDRSGAAPAKRKAAGRGVGRVFPL